MTKTWRLAVAVCAALPLAVACDGGSSVERTGDPAPDNEPSVEDPVVEDETCTDESVICPVGQTCNETTGRCEAPLCDPACEDGLRCDAATRTCVAPDPCAELACDSGEKCYAYLPSEVPATGERAICISNCKINPSGDKVTCPEGQSCNPANGFCDCDGGPCEGDVGTACNDNDDCLGSGANRRCLTFFDKGYCSSECGNSDCPAGSTCVDFGDFLCLDLCAGHRDCRDGYRCVSLQDLDTCYSEGKVCLPESERSDCQGGDCVVSGEACEDTQECWEGGFCASAWPDGTCLLEGCDPLEEERACPDGSTCVPSIPGYFNSPICMMGCDTFTKDCRNGYFCGIGNDLNSTGGCVPLQCDDDSDCAGEVVRNCDGEIIRKNDNELCDTVMGSCDIPCTNDFDCGAPCLDMADEDCEVDREGIGTGRLCDRDSKRCFTPCDNDEVCGQYGYCDYEIGRCTSACELDSECPLGNSCSNDGRCKPPCVDDAGCQGDQYCDVGTGECINPCQDDRDCPEGLECRRRIERCVRPLDDVPVGEACNNNSDCREGSGGECLRNRDGFPGGYCTARGCNDIETCPRDSACRLADLPGAAGLVAACFEGCERRADCRDDYQCEQGVCQPDGMSIVGPPSDPETPDPEGGEGEGEGEAVEPVDGGEGEGEGEPDNG